MSSNDGHGAAVSQGDLVGVIAANAHGVQVPEVGALSNTAALHVLADLLIHRLQELVAHVVAGLHGLICSAAQTSVQSKTFSRKRYQSAGTHEEVV